MEKHLRKIIDGMKGMGYGEDHDYRQGYVLALKQVIQLKDKIIESEKERAGEANAFTCFHMLIDDINDALSVNRDAVIDGTEAKE